MGPCSAVDCEDRGLEGSCCGHTVFFVLSELREKRDAVVMMMWWGGS